MTTEISTIPTEESNSSQLSTIPTATPMPVLPVPPPPRETIINTAVKFLANPRVRGTLQEQKESFLRQKGLTENEIKVACQRAGVYNQEQDQQEHIVGSLPALPHRRPQPIQCSQKFPLWIKLRDIGNMVALLSIGSYSLYALWKYHIGPWLFGSPPSRPAQKHEVLLQAISSLNESVGELRALVQKLETHLANMPKGKSGGKGRSKEVHALEDVKEELCSIKALLLSRTQFPSSPGIPSWQLVSMTKEGASGGTSRDQSPHPTDEANEKGDDGDGGGRARKESRGTSSSSRDSVALHSDSSCEVVMIGGKQDSDHSDE